MSVTLLNEKLSWGYNLLCYTNKYNDKLQQYEFKNKQLMHITGEYCKKYCYSIEFDFSLGFDIAGNFTLSIYNLPATTATSLMKSGGGLYGAKNKVELGTEMWLRTSLSYRGSSLRQVNSGMAVDFQVRNCFTTGIETRITTFQGTTCINVVKSFNDKTTDIANSDVNTQIDIYKTQKLNETKAGDSQETKFVKELIRKCNMDLYYEEKHNYPLLDTDQQLLIYTIDSNCKFYDALRKYFPDRNFYTQGKELLSFPKNFEKFKARTNFTLMEKAQILWVEQYIKSLPKITIDESNNEIFDLPTMDGNSPVVQIGIAGNFAINIYDTIDLKCITPIVKCFSGTYKVTAINHKGRFSQTTGSSLRTYLTLTPWNFFNS